MRDHHCILQDFFAKMAQGTGLNIPQDLLKQGLAGSNHARPADEICVLSTTHVAAQPSNLFVCDNGQASIGC